MTSFGVGLSLKEKKKKSLECIILHVFSAALFLLPFSVCCIFVCALVICFGALY